jgi:hypothetical protein
MARKTTTSTPKAKPRRTAPVKAKSNVVESTPAPSVRRERPIFQAGTWIAVLLFAALIGFAVYLKSEKEKKADTVEVTPVSETAAVFAENDIVTSIQIKPTDGETVKVTRNAENVWAVELPLEAEADQGLVEAAAAQISALQVISPIAAGSDPEIFGLKDPAYIITIEFKGGTTRALEVGEVTPTNSGYYARLDKDKMMVTDLSGIESLLQLGFFPPYLNTPAPASLPPTATPAP